jgi:hypothetical protein
MCRPTSNLFGDATTLVTDYRWQAFNAASRDRIKQRRSIA